MLTSWKEPFGEEGGIVAQAAGTDRPQAQDEEADVRTYGMPSPDESDDEAEYDPNY